ncbi:MAG: substrate-binding domain-containing protein [Proteobacteria bacterium]|nr:substrate-binding domain-containing protein [Pseudomonadota bacterium]
MNLFSKLILGCFFIITLSNEIFAKELKIVGGSTSINTVLEPIKPSFEKETGIKLTLLPIGSKKALIELDKGSFEVASTAHSLKELIEELEKENVFLKNKNQFKTHIIHKSTEYSVIVNIDNPVKKLSKEQLKSIFLGKIKNWKEVGGNDLPIHVIWGTLTEGTKNEVKKQILNNENPVDSAVQASTVNSIINIVASDPRAISVVSSASITSIKAKPITAPEIISAPIILITVGEPSKVVSMLINFIQKEGYKYIKD